MSDTKSIKIGMFGGGGVGKTCITLRYLKGEFSDGYIPTIEDEFTKVIEVDNQTISLGVIDTAGQDDFSEMRYSYFGQVQAFIFVIDISNPQSIDDFKKIYNDAKDATDDGMVCVIAANKIDLRDEGKSDLIPKEDYKKLENEFNCNVIETSAKTNVGIDELYLNVIKKLLKKDKPQQEKTSSDKKASSSKKEKESGGEGGCCLIA